MQRNDLGRRLRSEVPIDIGTLQESHQSGHRVALSTRAAFGRALAAGLSRAGLRDRRARNAALFARSRQNNVRIWKSRVLFARARSSRKASLLATDTSPCFVSIVSGRARFVSPLKEPFRISSGVCTERRVFLLELHDADGTSTWAECVAGEQPNYTPETIDTAWFAIREWLAPRLLGRSFDGPEVIHGVLEQSVRGYNMAKAALEMGMWALAATKEGVSLSHRLGGTRERIPTGISLGIQANPDALVDARSRVRAGLSQDQTQDSAGAGRGVLGAGANGVGRTSISWPTRTPLTRSPTPITSPSSTRSTSS